MIDEGGSEAVRSRRSRSVDARNEGETRCGKIEFTNLSRGCVGAEVSEVVDSIGDSTMELGT